MEVEEGAAQAETSKQATRVETHEFGCSPMKIELIDQGTNLSREDRLSLRAELATLGPLEIEYALRDTLGEVRYEEQKPLVEGIIGKILDREIRPVVLVVSDCTQTDLTGEGIQAMTSANKERQNQMQSEKKQPNPATANTMQSPSPAKSHKGEEILLTSNSKAGRKAFLNAALTLFEEKLQKVNELFAKEADEEQGDKQDSEDGGEDGEGDDHEEEEENGTEEEIFREQLREIVSHALGEDFFKARSKRSVALAKSRQSKKSKKVVAPKKRKSDTYEADQKEAYAEAVAAAVEVAAPPALTRRARGKKGAAAQASQGGDEADEGGAATNEAG